MSGELRTKKFLEKLDEMIELMVREQERQNERYQRTRRELGEMKN